MKNEALNLAIGRFKTLKAFADALSTMERPVSYQVVQQWLINRVPADYCPSIERITDREVTCEQLRPDVEWAVLRFSCAAPESGRHACDKKG
ncbi:transcriptional regulator [Noviherbaspirillum autotrophicum]|uniref:transcriptional regulator n=1 Tax=Noviherbaspirillum autotrophicum TaxID=709839 RepID=UPI000A07603C|nr:YdaS family helix-turn-helix protein [Noviherbaspirillum autotrophicum]